MKSATGFKNSLTNKHKSKFALHEYVCINIFYHDVFSIYDIRCDNEASHGF